MNAISPASRITAPGMFTQDAEAYHASPGLSASGAWTLATECPATYQHERQNPEHKRCFDIGTAGHLMVLEPDLFDGRVAIVRGVNKDGSPSEGYASASAKAQRDEAYATGKVPLLPSEVTMVRAMRKALWADPIAKHAFSAGKVEQSLFWRDEEFGIQCRTRPDYLPMHGRYLINYKTANSANPRAFAKSVWDLGYHAKAAWELDGFAACTGQMPERFAFVVQSKKPPHLVSVCWMDPEDIAWGRIQNRYAKGVFAWCQERGEWPSHRPDVAAPAAAFTISLPGWARRELEQRHEAGGFTPPQERSAALAAAE